MRFKLKILFKWLLSTLMLLVIIQVIHFFILAYPKLFFENEIKYKRYSIYYDAPITWEVLKTFDEVEDRLTAIEIFDSSFAPKIYICHDQKLYSFLTFLLGMNSNSSGVNISLVDNTFLNISRIEKLKADHDRRILHSHIAGKTEQIIAHELIHNLSQKKIGWCAYRRLPKWKREGYAEFGSVISKIGYDKNFESLFERSKIYFEQDLFNAPFHSKEYYKFQLQVEYLFKVKKYSFDEFIKDTNSEKSVFNDFQNWYKGMKNKVQ
jgi:hypothetical protein